MASSTSGGSASTEPTGRSSCDAVRSRQAASSRRDGAGARVELADARQALPHGLRVALVGGALESPALLARPFQAPALAQATLQLVGELEQVQDVLLCVAQLLGGERPGIPPGVARGLADAPAEDRADQVAVAGLRARPGEPSGDLRVEDVRQLGAPDAAQDRDVLPTGMEHDLDLRVGHQLGERREVECLVERVDQERSEMPSGSSGASTTICTRHRSAR